MRVLIVSQYFWPENFRVNDLASELQKRGHRVTVLTGLPNYPDGVVFKEYCADPSRFMSLDEVKIVRVPLFPRGKSGIHLLLNYVSFTLSAAVVGIWKLRGQSFDVVFTNQLSPVTVALPAALIAKSKKIPMAMWVLDLWPDTLQAIGVVRSPIVLSWAKALVAYIYRRCDLILAQSNSFIPEIKKLAGSKARVEYLPSWAEDLFKTTVIKSDSKIICLLPH